PCWIVRWCNGLRRQERCEQNSSNYWKHHPVAESSTVCRTIVIPARQVSSWPISEIIIHNASLMWRTKHPQTKNLEVFRKLGVGPGGKSVIILPKKHQDPNEGHLFNRVRCGRRFVGARRPGGSNQFCWHDREGIHLRARIPPAQAAECTGMFGFGRAAARPQRARLAASIRSVGALNSDHLHHWA